MPKVETRTSSRGKFRYQELSFSNPRRRNTRVSLSPVRSAIVTNTPARSISTPPTIRSQPRFPLAHINRSLVYMAQPRAHTFSTSNGRSPLLLAQIHDIPIAALKSIPEFTDETSISP